jgi:hypothetical protein
MSKKQYDLKMQAVNNKYWELRLELLKLNANLDQFRRLIQIRKSLEAKVKAEYGDDLSALNDGKGIRV